MKKLSFLILFTLVANHYCYSQKEYSTSMSFPFKDQKLMFVQLGSDCMAPDIVSSIDTADGIMNLVVNKKCHSWSFGQHWMGNPYARSIVFKKRYIELRIKSTAEHDTSMSISFQTSGGNPNGSIGKSIPPISYKIYNANTWEIKLLKVEGDADTVFKEVDYNFDNGTYNLDYILYGDAAVPPIPAIDQKLDQVFGENQSCKITLTGIKIPNRPLDGLIMSVKSKTDSVLKDLVMTKETSIDGLSKSVELDFSTLPGTLGMSDSIFVTLNDTIRKTTKTMSFKVSVGNVAMPAWSEPIRIYPTVTKDEITIDVPQDMPVTIDLMDVSGYVLKSVTKTSGKTTIHCENFPGGMYLLRIGNGTNSTIKKFIKQ